MSTSTTKKADDAKNAVTTADTDTGTTTDMNESALIAKLFSDADPSLKGALTSRMEEVGLDTGHCLAAGTALYSCAAGIKLESIAPRYHYADGVRTDVVEGVTVTAKGWGGTIRVAIDGADEATYQHLRRGQRVIFHGLHARLGVSRGGTATAYYSADDVEAM